jgi:hypothetical protein
MKMKDKIKVLKLLERAFASLWRSPAHTDFFLRFKSSALFDAADLEAPDAGSDGEDDFDRDSDDEEDGDEELADDFGLDEEDEGVTLEDFEQNEEG